MEFVFVVPRTELFPTSTPHGIEFFGSELSEEAFHVCVEEHGFFVIPHEVEVQVSAQLQAGTRIGTVADHIAEAIHRIDVLPLDVLEYRFERSEIGVNVRDNSSSQMTLQRSVKLTDDSAID